VSLDWLELELLCKELNLKYQGYKVQEIYHPSDSQVLLVLYGDSGKHHWIIQLEPGLACIYPVPAKGKMPSAPSSFCSKLRKHLENSRLVKIESISSDRICQFEFSGKEGSFRLWIDLRPQCANLILTDEEEQVLISLNHEKGKEPGPWKIPTHPLPSFEEVEWNEEEVEKAFQDEDSSYFISRAREFTPKLIHWFFSLVKTSPFSQFAGSQLELVRNSPVQELLIDELGIHSFNIYPGLSWSFERVEKGSFGDLFAEYFPEFERRRLLRKVKTRVVTSLEKELGRLEKRREKLLEKKAQYEAHGKIEQIASLLSSQREKVQPFSTSVVLINYFDDCRELKVELDARISASQNVDRYYKKAKKFKRGIPKIEAQIEDLGQTAKTLGRELGRLKHETDFHKIEERFSSLQGLGFIPKKQGKPGDGIKKPKASMLRTFLSSEGSRIYSGRSDKENDYIRKNVGRKEDLWFHVDGAPGAHVLLKKSENMTGTSIREAAQLAAYFSKKKYEGKARVLYTELKYVKNVGGLGPGKVRLDQCRSLTVRLDHGIISRLQTLTDDS